MFKLKYNLIIAVQEDDVCWLSGHHGAGDQQSYRLPLDQVLDRKDATLQLPQWLKGKQKPLCVVPDHWLGNQRYPFQSKKPALIEPFLERKLTAACPGQEAVRHFFNYRHVGDGKDKDLEVLFLQEDKSYQLYAALNNLNHAPWQITSPAFLWEELLGGGDDDFKQQGTLLIHHTRDECHLYFYHKGNYQFSRSVLLTDGEGDLDNLAFEINQSLYMFSQKAKSELDRIYMQCDAPQCREKLAGVLGREVIDLKSDRQQEPEAVPSQGWETLGGLLRQSHIDGSANFFGVMHRQVKQAMEWKSVQWAGIIIGLCLLGALLGEHFLVHKMLTAARRGYQTVQEATFEDDAAMALPEYASTLDQVLAMAHQSELADSVHRISAGFPGGTRLKELDFKIESPPTVKIKCIVWARNADELQIVLSRLIAQLKEKYDTTRPLTINDIDIQPNQDYGGQEVNNYQIEYQLELR